MRTPALTELQEFPGLWSRRPPIGGTKSIPDAKIVDRQNIRTSQLENEQHFHAPTSDAATLGQTLDNFVVRQLAEHAPLWNHSIDGPSGDIVDGSDFSSRKTCRPQRCLRKPQDILWTRKPAFGNQGNESSKDGVCGFPMKLLVGNCTHQRFKG